MPCGRASSGEGAVAQGCAVKIQIFLCPCEKGITTVREADLTVGYNS